MAIDQISLPALDPAAAVVALADGGTVLLDVREHDEWMVTPQRPRTSP